MKSLRFFVAGLALLAAAPSFAQVDLSNNVIGLADCGGYAKLVKSSYGVNLVLDEVKYCKTVVVSAFEAGAGDYKLNEQFDKTFSGSIALSNGNGTHVYQVTVRSGSGKHADTFTVAYSSNPVRSSYLTLNDLTGNTYTRLPSCGGSAELNIQNGQVNLVFRDVERCSRFDILSDSEGPINYPTKELQEQRSGRGGSFTLPKSVISLGFNGVIVVVKSTSGKTVDYIKVKFIALPRF